MDNYFSIRDWLGYYQGFYSTKEKIENARKHFKEIKQKNKLKDLYLDYNKITKKIILKIMRYLESFKKNFF